MPKLLPRVAALVLIPFLLAAHESLPVNATPSPMQEAALAERPVAFRVRNEAVFNVIAAAAVFLAVTGIGSAQEQAALTWQLETQAAVASADKTAEAANHLFLFSTVENGQAFLKTLGPVESAMGQANAEYAGPDPLGLGAESLSSIEDRLDKAYETVEAVDWLATPKPAQPAYTFWQRLRHSADVLANPLGHWEEKYRLMGIPLPMHIHALVGRLAPHPGYKGRRDQIEIMWNDPNLKWETIDKAWKVRIAASRDLSQAINALLGTDYAEKAAREKIEPGVRLRETYKTMVRMRTDAAEALNDFGKSPASEQARDVFLHVQTQAIEARSAFLSELSPVQRDNFTAWESAQIRRWMAQARYADAALKDAAAARERQEIPISDEKFDELFGQPKYLGSPRRAQTPPTFEQKTPLPTMPRVNVPHPWLREHLQKMIHPKYHPYILGAA